MDNESKQTGLTGFILKTPFKGLVTNLCADIKRICPYTENFICEYSDQLITRSAIWSLIAVTAFVLLNIFLKSLNLYTIAFSILIVYVITQEYINTKLFHLQAQIDKEFSLFLSSVKNAYNTSHSVIYSLRTAAESYSIEVQRYATMIEAMLSEKHAKSHVNEYISDYRNSTYIRLFISSCYRCLTSGDSKGSDGTSVFCKNMQIIKEELESHILREDKTRFKFLGFTAVAVLPGVFLNLFKFLALAFMDGTKVFYDTYGLFIQAATVGFTWYVYTVIYRIKTRRAKNESGLIKVYNKVSGITRYEPGPRYADRLREKLSLTGRTITPTAFCNKMIMIAVLTFFASITTTTIFHINSRISTLNDPKMDIAVSAADEEIARKTVIKYAKMYKNNYDTVDKKLLDTSIGQALSRNVPYVREKMIAEIERRIDAYHSIKIMTWGQYLLCLLTSVLIGLMPLISLEFQWRIYQSKKNEEIRLFQIAILLMKDNPTTTVMSLLTAMEQQSFLYKNVLMQVTNEYSHDAERALRMLRAECNSKTEADALFTELVNSICNVTRVGMGAFINIENDIDFAKRYDLLTEEKRFSSSSVILETLSYIPSIIVIGAYFILPFILVSWQEISNSLTVIEEIM